MRAARLAGVVMIFTLGASALALAAADHGTSAHGKQALAEHQCLSCHRLEGEGDGDAPDLARRPMSTLHSPAGFAALMWNHAPEMWKRAKTEGLELDDLTEHDADDLFAYLWSIRYFDPRGEAIRGKRIVVDRGCAHCHSMALTQTGSLVPSFDWAALGDPAVLAQRMWNHSEKMLEEMTAKGIGWPQLSEGDMADLLTYLQNLEPARNQPRTLTITDPENGRRVFASKGCAACHERGEDHGLGARRPHHHETYSGLAAAFWNHTPGMQRKARAAGIEMSELSLEEMRALTSYLYATGYFGDRGEAIRGARMFKKRGCASCHRRGGGSTPLTGIKKGHSAPGMVAALWQHGPEMLENLEATGGEWPELSERDMADLIAFLTYLNSSS